MRDTRNVERTLRIGTAEVVMERGPNGSHVVFVVVGKIVRPTRSAGV